jgi:hypothetical protein
LPHSKDLARTSPSTFLFLPIYMSNSVATLLSATQSLLPGFWPGGHELSQSEKTSATEPLPKRQRRRRWAVYSWDHVLVSTAVSQKVQKTFQTQKCPQNGPLLHMVKTGYALRFCRICAIVCPRLSGNKDRCPASRLTRAVGMGMVVHRRNGPAPPSIRNA